MLIQQTEEAGKGKFYVEVDGVQLAEMAYHMSADNVMVIEHTEVDESLKGKNVGKQLVHQGVEYARSKGIKILPLCPFANAVIHKTKEYHDVLAS